MAAAATLNQAANQAKDLVYARTITTGVKTPMQAFLTACVAAIPGDDPDPRKRSISNLFIIARRITEESTLQTPFEIEQVALLVWMICRQASHFSLTFVAAGVAILAAFNANW